MIYNNEDLKKALKDDLVYFDDSHNFVIDNFVLDNREITKNSLFVAKKGATNDGHMFIANTLKNEGTAAIIAEYIPEGVDKDPRIILVKNSIKAMENLARYSRKRIKGHVIGITGSVGKTSTKEIFNHCLSVVGKAHCNVRSLNTYNGVIATLINTPSDTEFAIFEMGMNTYGEMDVLRDLVKPEIAVITNIFPIHIGNFKNEEEIAIEKSKISDIDTKALVLNKDNEWYGLLLSDAKDKGIKNVLSFAKDNSKADVVFKSFTTDRTGAKIEYLIDSKTYSSKTENLDFSMSYNLSSLLAVAKYLKLDIQKILDAFADYKTADGRNNVEKFNNLTVINGSYNANIESLMSGLELMNNIKEEGQRKVCIFADMLELGKESINIHLQLVKPLKDTKVDVFMATGENMKHVVDELKDSGIELHYFENIDAMVNGYRSLLKDNDLVFIKSSRDSFTSRVVNDIRKNY